MFERGRYGWHVGPFAINVALHVLFPTIITALALPECGLLTRPDQVLWGTDSVWANTRAHVYDPSLCHCFRAGSVSMAPDTAVHAVQSLGSQPEIYQVHWKEGGYGWVDVKSLVRLCWNGIFCTISVRHWGWSSVSLLLVTSPSLHWIAPATVFVADG